MWTQDTCPYTSVSFACAIRSIAWRLNYINVVTTDWISELNHLCVCVWRGLGLEGGVKILNPAFLKQVFYYGYSNPPLYSTKDHHEVTTITLQKFIKHTLKIHKNIKLFLPPPPQQKIFLALWEVEDPIRLIQYTPSMVYKSSRYDMETSWHLSTSLCTTLPYKYVHHVSCCGTDTSKLNMYPICWRILQTERFISNLIL